MTVTIRWAQATDAAFPFVAEHVPPDVVASRIAASRIVIAELDGRPVGALQLEYLWGTRPYIALIQVESGAQRQGVGRAA